jgi:hypothetical protein
MRGGKMIPVEESFAEWRKDPDYVKAYNALEDEFSRAAAVIRAPDIETRRGIARLSDAARSSRRCARSKASVTRGE